MDIAVVGLGLIGGSFCKAIKKYTSHKCLGLDTDPNVLSAALAEGAIDAAISADNLNEADISIICLYPEQIVAFAKENINRFKKGSLVLDAGGVKAEICEKLFLVFEGSGVSFVGAHPMAGREFSGYANSDADLFLGASFIVCPYQKTPDEKIKAIESLSKELGFLKFVVADPHEHDRIIAYTSQLAHIVSNAYVKSPVIDSKAGFFAGSFLDLTRVARLNEEMWSSLMLLNRAHLADELKNLMGNLNKYLAALNSGDSETLRGLLREGREIKEKSE